MGPAGRAAAALPGGHVEGFGDTFGALFRAIYADVAAGRPSADPPYATFADGHDEMLVNDAIAQSAADAALGRRRSRDHAAASAGHPRRPPGRRPPLRGGTRMRLGLLTAPFPETPLDEVADWTAANGFEVDRDRLLAARPAATPGATPARRTSTSRT